MKRTAILCLAAACFLWAGSATHADQISYSFNTSFAPIFFDHTLGGARLTDSAGVLPATSGSVSTNLVAFSFAHPLLPQNVSIPINLSLTDLNTGGSQTLAMGTISGHLSIFGSGLSFTPSQQPLSATFGNSTFNFSNPNFSFTSGVLLSSGSLSFSVVDPPSNPPITPPGGTISSSGGAIATPEPSSLALAGIGMPLFGLILRRRRTR